MAESRVSVGASLSYAWHLWRSSARSIWGVLALSSLAWTVCYAGDLADNRMVALAGMAAGQLLSLATMGTMYRLAFAEDHPGDPAFALGHLGLQWGRTEWRLLGASLLLTLFLAIIVVLEFVVVGAICLGILANKGGPAPPATPQALLAALGPDGAPVLKVLFYLACCGLLFIWGRLLLTTAASADSGRIKVLATWRLTKGQFWRLLASAIVVGLPMIFAEFMVLALAQSDRIDPTSVPQFSAGGAVAGGLLLGAIAGALVGPLTAGVLAYYYRHLRTPAAGANDKKP